MARLARKGSSQMPVRNTAVEIVTKGFNDGKGLRQKDFVGEAKRLHAFVRDGIRYVGDIDGIETLHDPVTLLRLGAGDCDDKAILLASLLLSINHTPRFIAVGFAPEEFSHVWVQDCLDGGWVDLEPTEPVDFEQSIPMAGVVEQITQDI